MAADKHNIEQAKAESTLQLLFRAARLVNDHALTRVHESTGIEIRPSHTNLFPHIDHEGTRLTELARRVGVSKQAVAVLVDDLVESGGLERIPDPADGRAKLICFRPGWLMKGLGTLQAVEEELGAKLKPGDMKKLHGILTRILSQVENPG